MVVVQKVLKTAYAGNQYSFSQLLDTRAGGKSSGDKAKKDGKKSFAETLREKMRG